tara:strand:- start:2273 stop:2524 length:252 start_codon:yes stop_codon:yes gene_type:complete
MDKLLKSIIILYFLLFLIVIPFAKTAEAANILISDNIENIDNDKFTEEKLDDLLGPDVNFPFRPENHRNTSTPVTRIAPINDD